MNRRLVKQYEISLDKIKYSLKWCFLGIFNGLRKWSLEKNTGTALYVNTIMYSMQ